MKDLINLENIGNPEVLENITNWSEIKNHVKIRKEKWICIVKKTIGRLRYYDLLNMWYNDFR